MSQEFRIHRKIEIDAGHRVPDHGSKCRNLHGHRYVIEAHCIGKLGEHEETGMVIDFGFLKAEMMDYIDAYYDHAMILWEKDPLVEHFQKLIDAGVEGIDKLITVKTVPTAENLAKIWFDTLRPRVKERTDSRARLAQIVVWETPNCAAIYPQTATIDISWGDEEALFPEPNPQDYDETDSEGRLI